MAAASGEWSDDVREALARAIHENYRAGQAGRKPGDDPAMADWERLPEHLRESNREQHRPPLPPRDG